MTLSEFNALAIFLKVSIRSLLSVTIKICLIVFGIRLSFFCFVSKTTAWYVIWLAICRVFLSILAENISTCVYFISDLRIANICSQYVLSISLSASSITSVLTSCTRSFFWRINCKIRAGVPTTNAGFVLSDSIWRLIFPSPIRNNALYGSCAPLKSNSASLHTWTASSCVGTSINVCIYLLSGCIVAITGSK